MSYILYINLKNLDWPAQSVLPNGLCVANKPHAMFITGITDLAQINLLQDGVSVGGEVTVEIEGDVVGALPAWVTRVSFTSFCLSFQRRLGSINLQQKCQQSISCTSDNLPMDPSLRWNDKIIVNVDYTIDNRLSWHTHQKALENLLPHMQHLSIYGLQRHDIKQPLQAWLASKGWGFYDAFHAKPIAVQPCQFLVDSYNLDVPLLGVGAGAYSRWLHQGVWSERKLNGQGKGAWQILTTK